MNKRTFLRTSLLGIGGFMTAPLFSKAGIGKVGIKESFLSEKGRFKLPSLPYAYNALEPHIDAKTMEIHHSRHHNAYVNNLNNALDEREEKSIEEIMASISSYSDAVRNNGGGHYNHALFWEIMSPGGGGKPSGELLRAINGSFDSFDKFKEQFSYQASTRFGSGWAWLVAEDGKLVVSSTPNQDNPLMDIAEVKGTPILGLDVWEHAYYLKYQNRRGDYISQFWEVVNWNAVAERLQKASKK